MPSDLGNSGGAINNTGDVEITGGSIENNTSANNGGAIYTAADTTLKIVNGSFTGNQAVKAGGAICANGADITLEGVTMSGNNSRSSGTGASLSASAHGPVAANA